MKDNGAYDELTKDLSFKTTFTDKNKVAIVDKDGKVLDYNNKKDRKLLNKMLKKLKGSEKDLFKAIIDTKNTATLTANKSDDNVNIGETQGPGKNAVDRGEVEMVAKAGEEKGGFSASDIVKHEAMEAYLTSKTGKPLLQDTSPHFNNPFPGLINTSRQRKGAEKNTFFIDVKILPGSKAKGSYTFKKVLNKAGSKEGKIASVLYFPN